MRKKRFRTTAIATISAGLIALAAHYGQPLLEKYGGIGASDPPIAQKTPGEVSNQRETYQTTPAPWAGKILQKEAFDIGYDETHRNPAWVRYTLKQENRRTEMLKRPQVPFETDPGTQARVTSDEYKGSGYDRGHMAPSFAIGAFHGREAQIGTFVMSNVAPQKSEMNSGVWNSIERMEAEYAKRYNITVICGPIYKEGEAQKLPSGRVSIPVGFYKVIQRHTDGEVLCFFIKQDPKSPRPEEQLVALQAISNTSKLDIQSLLPFPVKNPTETKKKTW